MKILCLSDTHGFHNQIEVPSDIDMIIHSGDASNYREPVYNYIEMSDFISWYKILNVKHKIFVPGNHDTSIEQGLITRDDFEVNGIHLLMHESIEIEGIKIFGSPYTPKFGYGWAYNKEHNKIGDYWKEIPDNTNILITHGPPYGFRDYAYSKGMIRSVGCSALLKRVFQLKELKYHSFGHIHDNGGIKNNGAVPSTDGPLFINASMVRDHEFDKGITNQPIVIDYEY